jgi:hypothetical protein
MSEQTVKKIEAFNKSYGTLITFLWRFLFYPILALVFYSSISYLDSHYVSREYFDKAVAKIEQTQTEISGKLDTVIISNAGSAQKDVEAERRLAAVESKVERLGERIYKAHEE